VLLQGGADPTYVANDGSTARSIAKDSGRKVVELVIAEGSAIYGIAHSLPELSLESVKDGAFIEITTGSGWTPLIGACASGNAKVASELIAMGADVNRVEQDGWSSLHFAAINGFEETVDVLLAAGARTDIANINGNTAKSLAESANHGAVAAKIADAERAKSDL
jgi:ankyrin repeat protein